MPTDDRLLIDNVRFCKRNDPIAECKPMLLEKTASREALHEQARIETESALASGRRKRAIVGRVAETATPSSDSGLIMTTLFVVAGLVVMYILVTNTATPGLAW